MNYIGERIEVVCVDVDGNTANRIRLVIRLHNLHRVHA